MNLLYCLYVILIGIGAGFVQRVSGFGLGIFAMVFLPHFMPTHTAAAAICSLWACVTATYNSIRFRKNIVLKTALPMMCAALITIPIAVRLSSVVSGHVFKLLLGVVMIALSLYFLFFNKRIKIKPNLPNGLLAGALGGTLGGLFSTGGPPVVLYLSSAAPDNLAYFATIQFYFCCTNYYSTAMRILNGIITPDVLLYAAVGLIGCMAGNTIGGRVFDKLDSNKLKLIIYIGMIVSGIVLLF